MTRSPNSSSRSRPPGPAKKNAGTIDPTDAERGELLDAGDGIGHLGAEHRVDLDAVRIASGVSAAARTRLIRPPSRSASPSPGK